jgi:hypothetical protein
MMRRCKSLLLILLLAGCSPIRGCVESNFTLEPNSRPPIWFAEARGKDREVSVELTYWTNGDAVFELKGRFGNTIRKMSADSCWHPETRYTQNPDRSFTPPDGPEYVIVKAEGIVDVVEHQGLPGLFRMTDNASIIQRANESVARGECRGSP